MSTKEQIDKEARDAHALLEERFYKKGQLTKEEFDRLHGALWQAHEAKLVAGGFIKKPSDWKTEFKAATTDSERLAALAKGMGL